MGKPTTYNCKQIMIALGGHSVSGSGLAEDNFVGYEKNGDGTTTKYGCDGEIVRSIDPNGSYKVTLSLLYSSPTNGYLQNQYNKDQASNDGYFPIMIKDLMGKTLFQAEYAWVAKPGSRQFGKEAPNMEWEIQTGEATAVEA